MRLIDADALMKDVRKNSESYFADDFAHEWVDRQPTVEMEPMIRCKQCRYYKKNLEDQYGDITYVWNHFCEKWINTTDPEGHCFKAEEKSMTESEKTMICELAEQGYTDFEISEKVFYCETSIRRARLAAGLRKKRGARVSESRVAKVKKYHDDGMSIKGIARLMGMSPNTVRNYLKHEGKAQEQQ